MGNMFCTAPHKIQWALSASKKIKRLQDRIATPMAGISLILGQQVIQTTLRMPSNIQTQIAHTMDTALHSSLRNFKEFTTSELDAISVSQTEITKAVVQQTLDYATQSSSLHNKLDQVDITIKALENSLQKASTTKTNSKPEVSQSEIKRAVCNITESIWLILSSLQLLIYELILLLAPYILTLYRTIIYPLKFSGDHFLFEDSLGKVRRLPCAQFQYWNSFYDLLKICFEDSPWLSLILSNRFMLMNGYYSHPISKEAWRAVIQPSSKVIMAMVLRGEPIKPGRCVNPSCTGKYPPSPAKTIQLCTMCGKHSLLLTERRDFRKWSSQRMVFSQGSSLASMQNKMDLYAINCRSPSMTGNELKLFKRVVWEEQDIRVPTPILSHENDGSVPEAINSGLITEILAGQQRKTNENSASYSRLPGASGKPQSRVPLKGWFECCCCRREVNIQAWGQQCPDCSHEQCGGCDNICTTIIPKAG